MWRRSRLDDLTIEALLPTAVEERSPDLPCPSREVISDDLAGDESPVPPDAHELDVALHLRKTQEAVREAADQGRPRVEAALP